MNRAELQAQIDALQAELETLPEDETTVDSLKADVKTLAWLHAERDYHLLNAFNTVTTAINILAWLHAERAHHLQEFVESEQRLIARARAVKAAKTQAEQAAL